MYVEYDHYCEYVNLMNLCHLCTYILLFCAIYIYTFVSNVLEYLVQSLSSCEICFNRATTAYRALPDGHDFHFSKTPLDQTILQLYAPLYSDQKVEQQ